MLKNTVPSTPYACSELKSFFRQVGISYEHRRADSFIVRTKEFQSNFPCICFQFDTKTDYVTFWKVPAQNESTNLCLIRVPYCTVYNLIRKLLKFDVISDKQAQPLLSMFLASRLPSSNTAAILTKI